MPDEHNQPSLRVYAETLSPSEVAGYAQLLRRFRLDLVLAVRPFHLQEIARAVATLEAEGVRVALWPMIEDEKGRWPSVKNADAWIWFAEEVLRMVEKERAPLREVLFDLEPPFGSVRALTPGHFSPAALVRMAKRDPHAHGRAALVSFRNALREREITVSAAVVPLCVFAPRWEKVLGTPVTLLAPDLPSVMAYTTIYEGWSRRVFSRSDALTLLSITARRTLETYGARAGISLGTVGTGAFEDEPVYRSPDELLADVAVAREAGIHKLTLFDLGGVVRRGPPEAWLEAFTADGFSVPRAPAVPISESRRMRLFRCSLEGRWSSPYEPRDRRK
jgi:hypothetical protein